MTYQSITNHNATFFHPRPAGHRYGAICIHWWGDPAQHPTFDGTIRYLVYGGARHTASVHYVVEAGKVACLLDPDTQLSWGQGDGAAGWGNNYAISIECNPRASAGDYATVAELVRELRAAYGKNLPLRPHNAFTSTQCPGVWDLARIDRLAAAGGVVPASNVSKPPPAPKPAPKPAAKPNPNSIYWLVQRGDTLGKIADYYGGPTPQAIAQHNGIRDMNKLVVGQKVFIPGPLVWVVERGDTLAKIAAYYGLSASVVAANNGIRDPSRISVGQVIKII